MMVASKIKKVWYIFIRKESLVHIKLKIIIIIIIIIIIYKKDRDLKNKKSPSFLFLPNFNRG